LRKYIKENEASPRLDEIAEHFGVTSPTAHNTLKTLRNRGYITFGRTKKSGFFVRLLERAGTAEMVYEVPIVGNINQYGLLTDFPELVGHFPAVLPGIEPENVAALTFTEDIPKADILAKDIMIIDMGKRPQPGDIAVLPFGLQAKHFFLCDIHHLTMDKDMPNIEVASKYPLPEIMIDEELGQKLYWSPIGYTEENLEYYLEALEKANVPLGPIPPDYIVATALRLIRNLAL